MRKGVLLAIQSVCVLVAGVGASRTSMPQECIAFGTCLGLALGTAIDILSRWAVDAFGGEGGDH